MTMKNIKLSLIIFLIGFTSYSQVTWPLNYSTDGEIPNGTYIKDIDNVFLPYVGTWQGTWNGKTLVLQLQKISQQLQSFPNGDFYYRDILIGKYTVENNNTGTILENTLTLENNNEAKISNLAYPNNGDFSFLYLDKERCGNSGEIILSGNPNSNQLIYYYRYASYWRYFDCQYAEKEQIPIYIPKETMTLTKIN